MKKIKNLLILFFSVALFASCFSKPKDADLQASIRTALNANPATTNVSVEVTDAVATLNGEVQDPSAQTQANNIASGVKGVKSVNNNVSVAAPPAPVAPVEITADDPLSTAVRDAVKDFQGVTASVKDGIISVSGDIKAADWKRLKMSLDGLRPKKVDAVNLKIN